MYNISNISKNGLKSMQIKMDAVADELANSNTYGYKKKEISFVELLTNETNVNEVITSPNVNSFNTNVGSKSGLAKINFQQGPILQTPREYDMAIGGKGFFGVRDENDTLMLTRNGSFNIDKNYKISDDNGNALDIEFYIPTEEWNTYKLGIASNGEITEAIGEEGRVLGKIILYNPQVMDSLKPLGENRYLPSDNVKLFNSLEEDENFGEFVEFGDIVQYALEGSNVDITKTMADMITTQRAYSLNSRAFQTTDEMMSMINGIKQ